MNSEMSPTSRWNRFWQVGPGRAIHAALHNNVLDIDRRRALEELVTADDEPDRESVIEELTALYRELGSVLAELVGEDTRR